jgi:hypothetical protein
MGDSVQGSVRCIYPISVFYKSSRILHTLSYENGYLGRWKTAWIELEDVVPG